MHDPVHPLSNRAFNRKVLPSLKACKSIAILIWLCPCFQIYLLCILSSFSASTASLSERLLISSIISWVTSACRWLCTHMLSIPICCSSFASASLCATHIVVSGAVICLRNLLWKLWRVSGFGFFCGFPSAFVHFFWLFCPSADRLVRSESQLVPRLSGRLPCDSGFKLLFWPSLPASCCSGGKVFLSLSSCGFSDLFPFRCQEHFSGMHSLLFWSFQYDLQSELITSLLRVNNNCGTFVFSGIECSIVVYASIAA